MKLPLPPPPGRKKSIFLKRRSMEYFIETGSHSTHLNPSQNRWESWSDVKNDLAVTGVCLNFNVFKLILVLDTLPALAYSVFQRHFWKILKTDLNSPNANLYRWLTPINLPFKLSEWGTVLSCLSDFLSFLMIFSNKKSLLQGPWHSVWSILMPFH